MGARGLECISLKFIPLSGDNGGELPEFTNKVSFGLLKDLKVQGVRNATIDFRMYFSVAAVAKLTVHKEPTAFHRISLELLKCIREFKAVLLVMTATDKTKYRVEFICTLHGDKTSIDRAIRAYENPNISDTVTWLEIHSCMVIDLADVVHLVSRMPHLLMLGVNPDHVDEAALMILPLERIVPVYVREFTSTNSPLSI
ncbi:hypothetical protein EC988_001680 [Linderina pennispora]|nr:hypothetical protein EC988_001680 [Linderina pennispora]